MKVIVSKAKIAVNVVRSFNKLFKIEAITYENKSGGYTIEIKKELTPVEEARIEGFICGIEYADTMVPISASFYGQYITEAPK